MSSFVAKIDHHHRTIYLNLNEINYASVEDDAIKLSFIGSQSIFAILKTDFNNTAGFDKIKKEVIQFFDAVLIKTK